VWLDISPLTTAVGSTAWQEVVVPLTWFFLDSTVWRKKNACFSNNCNFVYFQYKRPLLTPKQPVIKAVLITYIDYSIISERWRPSCRTHIRSLSSKFCITFTSISCGTIAISSRMETFRLSTVRGFWFEVTPKERNRRQKNLVSVVAKGHAFFLRHPVVPAILSSCISNRCQTHSPDIQWICDLIVSLKVYNA